MVLGPRGAGPCSKPGNPTKRHIVNTSYKGVQREPIMVILLGIITCGIYFYYWWYVTTQDINKTLGEERMNPMLLLILSFVTCGLAFFYWMYQVDKALVEIGQRDQVPYNSNFMLWILLCFIGGVGGYLAAFQTQDFLNKLWLKRA